MDWLEECHPSEYDNVIEAIDSYEQRRSTLYDTMDRLDYTLDIWSYAPEAWEDPDLSRWAGIFNMVDESRRSATQLSGLQLAEIASAMSNLRQHTIRALREESYKQAIKAFTSYEAGSLDISTLASGTLWRLAGDIEYYGPNNLYHLILEQAIDLERAYDAAYTWHSGDPTEEKLTALKNKIAESKALIESLAAQLQSAQ